MQAIKAALSPNLTAVLSYYRALLKPRRDSLAAITRRTATRALYVHGMNDGCIGVELTAGIARAYSGGLTVHHIPRAGHFVHIEQPDAFNTHLLRFLGPPEQPSH